MPRKQKPWPTIIQAGDTGRFTWEQIDEAITKVMARREAREARAAKQKVAAGSLGAELPTAAPPSKSKRRPPSKNAEAAPSPKAKGVRTVAGPSDKQITERKMPSTKKPWRTVLVGGGSGRFTPEQIRAAVRAVKEKNERKAARLARKGSAPTASSAVRGGAEQATGPADSRRRASGGV
jgi:hypothetical protein